MMIHTHLYDEILCHDAQQQRLMIEKSRWFGSEASKSDSESEMV